MANRPRHGSVHLVRRPVRPAACAQRRGGVADADVLQRRSAESPALRRRRARRLRARAGRARATRSLPRHARRPWCSRRSANRSCGDWCRRSRSTTSRWWRRGARRCASCCGCITSGDSTSGERQIQGLVVGAQRAGVRARDRRAGTRIRARPSCRSGVRRGAVPRRRRVPVRERARTLPRALRDDEQLHAARRTLAAAEARRPGVATAGRVADPPLMRTRSDTAMAGGSYTPPERPAPDAALERALRDEPTAFSFFQAVRLLSQLRPTRSRGRWVGRPRRARPCASPRARRSGSRRARSSRS